MARKREINYFKDIKSDEDFNELLQSEGLIILDVHQNLFGPCWSIHSCLEKAKLSLMDSDRIQLANCDASKIEKLARFRNKCQPTVLFCHHGKVVDCVYGANLPLLSRTIESLLEFTEPIIDGKIERVFYEFDEPLPFERDEIDRENAAREATAKLLKEKIETETREKFNNVVELFRENARDSGVTLFMPHVAETAYKTISETAKWLSMLARSRKIIQITPEISDILSRYLENPIDGEVMNYVYDKEILAVLWSVGGDMEKILGQFLSNVSEPQLAQDDEGNRISGEFLPRILEPLIIQLDDGSVADNKSEGKRRSSLKSGNRKSSVRKSVRFDDGDSKRESKEESNQETKRESKIEEPKVEETEIKNENVLVIPPVWIPANKEGHALLAYFFFRKQFEHFLPPEEEPIPDHLLMIFPASQHEEVLKSCNDFPGQLLDFGFFAGESQENDISGINIQLICKAAEKYEQLPHNDNDKIMMKVAKRTSHLSLALTAMSPLYVSHNVSEGEMECSKIFNEHFYAFQDAVEESSEEEDEK